MYSSALSFHRPHSLQTQFSPSWRNQWQWNLADSKTTQGLDRLLFDQCYHSEKTHRYHSNKGRSKKNRRVFTNEPLVQIWLAPSSCYHHDSRSGWPDLICHRKGTGRTTRLVGHGAARAAMDSKCGGRTTCLINYAAATVAMDDSLFSAFDDDDSVSALSL